MTDRLSKSALLSFSCLSAVLLHIVVAEPQLYQQVLQPAAVWLLQQCYLLGSLCSGRLSGIILLAAVGLDCRMLSYFSYDSLCFERKAVSLILALSYDLLSVRLVSDGRRHCFDTALL